MDGVATDSKAPKQGCRGTRTRYQRGCNLSNLRGNPEGICRQFEANPEAVGCQNHPTGHLVYWSMLNVKTPHIRLVLGTSSLSPIRMGKQMSNIIPKIPKQNLFGCSPEFDFFPMCCPCFHSNLCDQAHAFPACGVHSGRPAARWRVSYHPHGAVPATQLRTQLRLALTRLDWTCFLVKC
jgi:hypothetical protein